MGMALSYVHAVYVTSVREWTADQGVLHPVPPDSTRHFVTTTGGAQTGDLFVPTPVTHAARLSVAPMMDWVGALKNTFITVR